MLTLTQGKSEIAFVCDKGNSCIRVIKGVHSFKGDKFVGNLKLQPNPLPSQNWKPEGLAVVSKDTIAVTEGTSLYLVSLDNSYTTGQLVKVLDGLQSPQGLCVAKAAGHVLVADGHTVKHVNIDRKSVEVVAQGFKQAFDVAVSSDDNIAVSDVQGHKITLLVKVENESYKTVGFIGTGTPGCCDGPATKAELCEPTGLCFDHNTIFCCFGGSKTGYIKLHSSVDFACNFMTNVRQIYHAIGFLPKKEQNRLAQIGKNPYAPFLEGVAKLKNSLVYLASL